MKHDRSLVWGCSPGSQSFTLTGLQPKHLQLYSHFSHISKLLPYYNFTIYILSKPFAA